MPSVTCLLTGGAVFLFAVFHFIVVWHSLTALVHRLPGCAAHDEVASASTLSNTSPDSNGSNAAANLILIAKASTWG